MKKWLMLVVSMCVLVVANIANAQLQPPAGGTLGNATYWQYWCPVVAPPAPNEFDRLVCQVYANVSSGRVGRLKMVVSLDFGNSTTELPPVYQDVFNTTPQKHTIQCTPVYTGNDPPCIISADVTLEVRDALNPNVWVAVPSMVSWECYPNYVDDSITMTNIVKYTNALMFDYETYSVGTISYSPTNGIYIKLFRADGSVVSQRIQNEVIFGVDKTYKHVYENSHMNQFTHVALVMQADGEIVATTGMIPLTTPPPTP